MSAEQTIAPIRQFFQAMDRADVSVLDEVATADYRLHFPASPVPLEREAAKGLFGVMLAAFPGVRHDIEDSVVEGDRAVVRLRIQGVHGGDFQGLAPTGRPVDFPSINVFHLRDGRIAEQWIQFDAMAVMRQIGAIPDPAQAEAAGAAT